MLNQLSASKEILEGFSSVNDEISDQGSGPNVFHLARALAILQIDAPAFHALHMQGKHEEIKLLFDKALKRRMRQYTNQKNTDLDETDVKIIHEAYQFLIKKFFTDPKNRKCDDPTCYISINEIISHQKRMDGSDGVGKSRRGSLQPGSDDEDQIGHSGSAGIADMKSRLNTRRGSFVPPKSPSMTRCSCGSRRGSLKNLEDINLKNNLLEQEPQTLVQLYRSDSEKSNGPPPPPSPTLSDPTSPTQKLAMEIDATFTHQMSEVDTILLPPNPVQFLEPSKLKRRESRKLSFKKSKKTDRPYALRKGSFKKYRQDSLNQGT